MARGSDMIRPGLVLSYGTGRPRVAGLPNRPLEDWWEDRVAVQSGRT